MISSIVQYEVYVQDGDRWALHARYPGAERDDALSDARRTEVNTGMPTKVVKDTYYPDENYSEEVTAYISPNAKIKKRKKSRGAKPRSPSRNGSIASSTHEHGQGSGKGQTLRFNAPLFFTRLMLSLAFGMMIAAGLTALLTLLLSALPKLGVNVSNSAGTKISLYWYLAMFVLSTFALNRAYVPWRSVFAKNPDDKKESQPIEAPKPQAKMRFAPKRTDEKRDAEAAKEQHELHLRRGDIPEPESLADRETDDLENFQTTDTPKATQNDTEENAPATEDVPPAPSQDMAKAEPEDIISDAESVDELGTFGQDTSAPLEELDIERLLMVRFLGDTLITIRGSQDQLDSSTRFGMSLYLAGAAAAVAEQHSLKSSEEHDILSESLHLIGLSEIMINSFFEQLNDNMQLKKNQALVAAGQSAMFDQLRPGEKSEFDFSSIVEEWKHNNHSKRSALGDIFLLTHITSSRSDPTPIDDELMGSHNKWVRQALDNNTGTETRHTGKGIFASFESPEDAICAAVEIQRECNSHSRGELQGPPICIAIVGTLPGDSGPALSGEAFSQADTLCNRLNPGQIAGDALIRDSSEIDDFRFGAKIPNAHSGIAEKVNAYEVLWDTLPA